MHSVISAAISTEILYDNMKQVVLKRAPVSSNSIWNSQFEDFFNYYGFIPRLCRPYRPQTKGKIENSVGFVKRDFLLGSEFCSFSDLNFQAQKWLARINSTVHGTTNEIPLERLKEEGLRDYNAVPPYHNIHSRFVFIDNRFYDAIITTYQAAITFE